MSGNNVAHHYNILGLDIGAAWGEIRKAYKRLSRRFHPDKNKEPGAEGIFKNIKHSYDELYKYFHPEEEQDQSEEENEEPIQDPPVFIDVSVTLEDIFKGKKKVKFTRYSFGKGRNPKYTKKDVPFHIMIDPGFRSGDQVKLGKGDQRPGHIPADIIWVLKKTEHPYFSVAHRSKTVHCKAKVYLWDALCGARIRVPALNGEGVVVDFPSLAEMRSVKEFLGLGLAYRSRRTGEVKYGRMVVEVEIVYPKNIPRDLYDTIRRLLPSLGVYGLEPLGHGPKPPRRNTPGEPNSNSDNTKVFNCAEDLRARPEQFSSIMMHENNDMVEEKQAYVSHFLGILKPRLAMAVGAARSRRMLDACDSPRATAAELLGWNVDEVLNRTRSVLGSVFRQMRRVGDAALQLPLNPRDAAGEKELILSTYVLHSLLRCTDVQPAVARDREAVIRLIAYLFDVTMDTAREQVMLAVPPPVPRARRGGGRRYRLVFNCTEDLRARPAQFSSIMMHENNDMVEEKQAYVSHFLGILKPRLAMAVGAARSRRMLDACDSPRATAAELLGWNVDAVLNRTRSVLGSVFRQMRRVGDAALQLPLNPRDAAGEKELILSTYVLHSLLRCTDVQPAVARDREAVIRLIAYLFDVTMDTAREQVMLAVPPPVPRARRGGGRRYR